MILTPPASRQVLPHQKFKRLIRSSDFRRIYRTGHHVTAHFLKLYYAENDIKHFRLGITVSKRISKKATMRNWYKRVIREWFRHYDIIAATPHCDIVIVVAKAVHTIPRGCAKLRQELTMLTQQNFT